MIKIDRPPKAELEGEYAMSKNLTELGRIHNVSRTTVKRWFQEYGIASEAIRKPAKVPSRELLDNQISGGMSNEMLSSEHQVHTTTIATWLRMYGLMSLRMREKIMRISETEKVVKVRKIELTPAHISGNLPQYICGIEHQQQVRVI